MKLNEYVDYLVGWLQSSAKEAHAKGMIVGLSGGLDSAVVAALLKRAFGDNALALIMPCHSNPQDQADALAVAKAIGIKYQILDLTNTYDALVDTLGDNVDISLNNTKLALGNSKARLRMTSLYAIGQMNHYLVVGTDNLDEWYTGYFTKHGDGGVDIVPLIHLVKGEVRQLAEMLNVPRIVIDKAPSAGLFSSQTDEQELGVSYHDLDRYLLELPVEQKVIERIEQLHRVSQHKRQLAKKPQAFILQCSNDNE